MKKFLIIGNWKMQGLRRDLVEIEVLAGSLASAAEVVVCPPMTLLGESLACARGSALRIGAQDCHVEEAGAHTGDVSAAMLADLGVGFVICGHSERRAAYGEGDAQVRSKAHAAQRAGLVPIVCVGATASERAQGETLPVLERQAQASVPLSGSYALADEPIGAIGTGSAAELEDIQRAHAHLLTFTDQPVLYGGSVKADNAASIAALGEVSGLLIGKASLKAQSFLSIIEACKPYC